MPDPVLTFTLVLIALGLLMFMYTVHKRIPVLGCTLAAILIVLGFIALLVLIPAR